MLKKKMQINSLVLLFVVVGRTHRQGWSKPARDWKNPNNPPRAGFSGFKKPGFSGFFKKIFFIKL